MAAIVRGIFTGEEEPEDEVEDKWGVWPVILPTVTHLSVHKSVTVIRSNIFRRHPIIELICHNALTKIEHGAFKDCFRLKRLIMSGVERIEVLAFGGCRAIEHVECGTLEMIRRWAFCNCVSLESIDLPSAKIIEEGAFEECTTLSDVKFGKYLESIGKRAFCNSGVKQITVPLKRGLFTHDDVFMGCDNFSQAYLLDEDEAIMQETVEALLLDEWKNDMNKELHSINQILPNAYAGESCYYVDIGEIETVGEKTRAIRDWIGRVLQKIIHYKVEHYHLLSLAAAVLAQVSPNEIVIDSALSFLQLPDHVFEGEGDSSATTPALDRIMRENVVQMKPITNNDADGLSQKRPRRS